MQVGLLMMGDFHFFGKDVKKDDKECKNQFIADRIEMLCKFLDGVKKGLTDIIIIINGDITDRAQKNEFSSAYYFIQKIKNVFENDSITTYFVFSKGNHDMTLVNNAFGTDAFDNYYYFVDRFVDYCDIEKNKYYDMYKISTLGVNINFVAMNPFSNCVSLDDFSRKNFVIDSECIKNNIRLSKKEINIILSHIPYEWYDRNNVNNFRFLDEQTFKIYSHEHNETTIKSDENKISIYLNCFSEETRKNICGIVFGYLDTITTKIDLQTYEYTCDGFVAKDKFDKYLTDSFGCDNSKYRLYRTPYEKFMNEDISTLCGEDVQLLDIFSEPRFYIIDDKEYKNAKTQDKVLSDVMEPTGFFKMILGGKKAGKTSVLKYVFYKELMNGKCPVYIQIGKNNSINGIEDKIRTFVKNIYINTYSDIVSNKEVVLLIDDFDMFQNPSEIDRIKEIVPFVEKVYIASSADYSSFEVADFSKDVCAFRIQPFGLEARYTLINKWVQKKYNSSLESEINYINNEILKMVNDISSDVLLSPDLVLIFLNAYSSNETDKLVSSSKIVYYQYLIKKYIVDLCNNIKISNTNYVEFFYKEIAYYMMKNETFSLKEFSDYFLNEYSIEPEEYYSNLKYFKYNKFFDIDSVEKFKLSFFKAYFIAEYYKTNIGKEDIKKELMLIIDHIAENDLYVNIILFFFFNNSYGEYLYRCVDNMNGIFDKAKLFDFENDIKVYNSFISDIRNNVKKDGKVIDNKKRMLREVDNSLSEQNAPAEKNELTMKLIASSNYLEICSEILPIIGKKDDSNMLLKAMLELGLRRISDFVTLSSYLLLKADDEDKFETVFYTSLAIISSLLDDISSKLFSSKVQTVVDLLSSYNMVSTECIKRKIDFFLLRKNGADSLKHIDSIINFKEKLYEKKNFIAAVYLLINIDIEINYIGAYDGKNTNLLVQKNNKNILNSHSMDPKVEMNNSVERKHIRRKGMSGYTNKNKNDNK